MNQKQLRLGIVGCGYIAHAHAAAAQSIPDKAQFVVCCDIKEDVAKAFAETYGCPAYYTDYVTMVEREELDGICLATMPSQHREQVERCIAAGAGNILCEKPFAMTAQEAWELWQIVTETGTFLMEGLMYRHHPAIRKMERILSIGDMGGSEYFLTNL